MILLAKVRSSLINLDHRFQIENEWFGEKYRYKDRIVVVTNLDAMHLCK